MRMKILKKLHSLDLNKNNRNFVSFLMSEQCKDALECNNIKIHVDSGDISVNNQDTNESIYHFFQNQQNENKK